MNKEKTIAKEYEDFLKEKIDYYGNTEAAKHFAAEAYANKRVTEAIKEVEKLKELAKEMLKKDISVAYMKGFIKAQEMFLNHIEKGTKIYYIKESDALAYAEKIIKKSEWLKV